MGEKIRNVTCYVNLEYLPVYCDCYLEKHPGVCLIGVGEVLLRIIGKAVMSDL